MSRLQELGDTLRGGLDERNRARETALGLSREIIRTSANTIRAAHRGELDAAAALLATAEERVSRLRAELGSLPDIYGAGYVHDCQKEFAEASVFLALVAGRDFPAPADLQVEAAAYLNGLGEAIGELRRHTLDTMRRGDLARAEQLLDTMDEIYYLLVTFDYPDALTGGLRRTTAAARGIIEKTRGELTTALRQEQLRAALEEALAAFPQGNANHGG